ncbi:MAG: GTP-binding protein [Nocardioides sp.]
MRTPLILVTGVDADVMAARTVGLLWDLPHAVAVRHTIDAEQHVLTRVVSDATGELERAEVNLEHACVTCAIREDIIPTLGRLATDARWKSIVAHLPVGAEAQHVCNALAWDTRLARHLRVSCVLVALCGPSLEQDLLADELLRERDAHCAYDDDRGVGETAASMIEYADILALIDDASTPGRQLISALARPNALVLGDDETVDTSRLLSGTMHSHHQSEAWVAVDRRDPLPRVDLSHAWRAEFVAARPFHPERLLERLEELGSGPHRSRGCFWLPTRPEIICEWDGAGGQLSIGSGSPWRKSARLTRLVFAGIGIQPPQLATSFRDLLLTDAEAHSHGESWERFEDGFEPWLGPIRQVA